MNNNTNRIEIELDGLKVSAILHPETVWVRNRLTKTRVYVSGEASVDFTDAYAMQRANAETHGSPFYGKGEFPAEDKLFAALNRQVVKNQKAVIEEVHETDEGLSEAILAGGKLTFSRTAGCACGCSPAFVPERMIVINGRKVESLFITKLAS